MLKSPMRLIHCTQKLLKELKVTAPVPAPDITYLWTRQGWLYLCMVLDPWDRRVVGWSMGRKGNCWDNAVAESFFGILKRELVYHETYGTRAEARLSVFQYIEGWYNRKRRHSTLGRLSPLAFEQAMVA